MKKKKLSLFTLIELLVVIAVITILAGLLLPSLGRAKELGKSIACMNKLKNMGIAAMSYSSDNNDYLTVNPTGSDTGATGKLWDTQLGPYLSWSYLEKSQPVYHCPSAKMSPNIVNTYYPNFDEWRSRCYSINTYILHTGTTYGMNKAIFFKYPSRAAAFIDVWDIDNPQYGLVSPFPCTATCYFVDTEGARERWAWRHNGRMNILFVDGHTVSAKRMANGKPGGNVEITPTRQ